MKKMAASAWSPSSERAAKYHQAYPRGAIVVSGRTFLLRHCPTTGRPAGAATSVASCRCVRMIGTPGRGKTMATARKPRPKTKSGRRRARKGVKLKPTELGPAELSLSPEALGAADPAAGALAAAIA